MIKLFKWYKQTGADDSPTFFYSRTYDSRFKDDMYRGLSEVNIERFGRPATSSKIDWFQAGPLSMPKGMFVERDPPTRESCLRLIPSIFKFGKKL